MKKSAYFILLFAFVLTYSLVSEGYEIYLTAQDELKQGIEGKLADISKRKEEMRLELEKLKKEEEQLRDDIKKEGRLISVRKKRELEHRSRELEEKIKRFIEELEMLNKEEGLLNTLKPI
ncbi:MAG: hypothetical protein HZA09_05515 [Nitrospirae bacterium]|nr:hypothetical protein [Nitrospirota bacterium]